MKTHEHLSTAKALIALLCLLIIAALAIKFVGSINYLYQDPGLLQTYVIFIIVAGGFLVGLLYFVSQTKHSVKAAKVKSVKASSKSTKSKKKKK